MVIIATLLLTAFHPRPSFAGEWSEANFTLRSRFKMSENGDDGTRSGEASGVEVGNTV